MPEYKLPDVGEGLTEAEVVAWRVKVGDVIEVNEIVCDIETAKSIVELPSPYAGEVTALLVPEGETVAVGTPIIRIGADEGAAAVAGHAAALGQRERHQHAGEVPVGHLQHRRGQRPSRRVDVEVALVGPHDDAVFAGDGQLGPQPLGFGDGTGRVVGTAKIYQIYLDLRQMREKTIFFRARHVNKSVISGIG